MTTTTTSSSRKRPSADDDDTDDSAHGGSGTGHAPKPKAARIDTSSDDAHFALPNANASASANSSSKRKSAGASRTGQACDRCKVRKIRCDARPGGCSPCIQTNTECKTTDRITGRATSRGHTEHLENENTQLKMYMVELQQQLRDNGVDPKPPPAVPHGYMGGAGEPYWTPSQTQGWDAGGSSVVNASPRTRERQGSQGSLLPDFRAGCIGDNYLGVSSENNWLSPIEGTSLALFGTKIDLAEYMPPDSDPASSAMSYRTFLSHAFGRTQPFSPPLPEYEQCKMYGEWYFRSVQIFIPLLHKPDFMRLLHKMYNESYHPTPAEKVMVHIVLAVMHFQFAARNGNDQARHDSMSHYHYALSFIPDLITGHKLEDIQALALICSQLRNQPRPGAAWMFTNMVMGLAVESGLHRSAKAWQGSAISKDPHCLEMRKRIFWSLLVFHAHISGKLGRPMPLRMEDFDIEIPEPLPDNLPGEPATTKWKKCSWRAAYHGFRLLKIIIQVYSSIYSIKSTGQYETNLRTLEKELETFHASIPPELNGGDQTKDEDRIAALYLNISVGECQLLLHHPSLCRSSSPQIISNNLDVCLEWSTKLLESAVSLQELKSLDTTWYYWTDFLAAIFTTLFVSTERRDQMDSEDLQRLRHDMEKWIGVVGEASTLLGTSPQLQTAVRGIIDFSIGNISRHIAAKTASAAVASVVSPTTQDQTQQMYENQTGPNNYYSNGVSNGDMTTSNGQAYAGHQHGHPQQAQNQYPSGAQFTYPPSQDAGITSYNTGGMSSYDASAYSGDVKPNIEAQLVAAGMGQQPTPTNFMAAFQSPPQTGTNGYQQHMNGHGEYPQSGPAAWRTFADNMMTNAGGQEYAGALMALSGKSTGGSMEMSATTMNNMHVPQGDGTQMWPLIAYNDAAHGAQQ